MRSAYPLETGLLAAGAVALGLVLLLPVLNRESGLARGAVLAVVAVLSIRYVVWRVTATLPPPAATFEALWPWFFMLTEVTVMANAVVVWLTVIRHADRSSAADAGVRSFQLGAPTPRVEVFIATYNEEPQILERTIVGAVNLDWPDFQVWVLDDGNRPWLKAMAEGKGAHWLARDDNKDAKAGNLNHALSVTDAPFVMVLDADFVPRRNFLKRTMGFFDDPRIGIVQTPQHFYNADPIQHNLLAARAWADEQRFFFDTLMPAKDGWDCAFCCGTSSVSRRAALERVGGFPTETITEDIHLTYKLFDHGYITRYLNENLSMGLAAEGMGEYQTQRARWCIGVIQQLFLQSGPLSRNRQTLMQRLQFFTGLLHWLLFPHRIVFMLAPIVFWFTGVTALKADLATIAHFFLPAFAANMLFVAWISRNAVFPVFWDVAQFVTSFVIARASLTALIHPRAQRFKVTDKGGTRAALVVHWNLVWKLLLLILLTASGMMTVAVPEWTMAPTEGRDVNTLWSVFNLVVLAFSLVAAVDLPRTRQDERFDIAEPTTLATPNGQTCSVVLHDLSLGGTLVAPTDDCLAAASTWPPSGRVYVPEVGWVQVEGVRPVAGGHAYCFVDIPEKTRDRLILKLFAGGLSKSIVQVPTLGLLRAAVRRALR